MCVNMVGLKQLDALRFLSMRTPRLKRALFPPFQSLELLSSPLCRSTRRTQGRSFSSTSPRRRIEDLTILPERVIVQYHGMQSSSVEGVMEDWSKTKLGTQKSDLLSLNWSQPPQNVLLVQKECSDVTDSALKEFANHIKSAYPSINILLESSAAAAVASDLDFPVHCQSHFESHSTSYHDKVDLITTFGGDGTILHASSLFATASTVPPILSFSMGTLGFLGEWKFTEYKRAFREVYMSGSELDRKRVLEPSEFDDKVSAGPTGWSSVRGKSLGSARGARILMRNRLKVGIFDASGKRLSSNGGSAAETQDVHAMNEVILHRGKDPHLAVVEVYVGGRFLTEAVSDGMIISTPTGSTAYSLSSGGSIIHPLVSSLLLTPICPRSLSFRPLVLPASTPITLKLSQKSRGREVEVSVDGRRRRKGIGVGEELRVSGEEITRKEGQLLGGIPCIMRQGSGGTDGDDGWVGGLNGLLKFNYPFGEEN